MLYEREEYFPFGDLFRKKDGTIELSTTGCGCCSGVETLNKNEIPNFIKDLEIMIDVLKQGLKD